MWEGEINRINVFTSWKNLHYHINWIFFPLPELNIQWLKIFYTNVSIVSRKCSSWSWTAKQRRDQGDGRVRWWCGSGFEMPTTSLRKGNVKKNHIRRWVTSITISTILCNRRHIRKGIPKVGPHFLYHSAMFLFRNYDIWSTKLVELWGCLSTTNFELLGERNYYFRLRTSLFMACRKEFWYYEGTKMHEDFSI